MYNYKNKGSKFAKKISPKTSIKTNVKTVAKSLNNLPKNIYKNNTDPILAKRLTTNQISKLEVSGITSLYQLITYLPTNLTKLVWWQDYDKVDVMAENEIYEDQIPVTYFTVAKLLSFSFKAGKRPYFVLKFGTEPLLTAYFFMYAKYMFKVLQEGQFYSIRLSKQGDFWQVSRLSAVSIPVNSVLEKHQNHPQIQPQTHFEVKYTSLAGISGLELLQIHKRLEPADYILNLEGLLPNSLGLENRISLWQAHHPNNKDEFNEAIGKYKKMELFLFSAFMHLMNKQDIGNQAVLAKSNLDFLHQIINQLPFELSISQTQAIKTIYGQLTYQ